MHSRRMRVEHVPAAGLIHGYFGFLGVVDAADKYARTVLDRLEALLP